MADTIDTPAKDAAYDIDFYLWTQQQAERIRQAGRDRVDAPIDWENVAAEIESVGISDKRQVKNLTRHIMVHLIKLRCSTWIEPRDHWRDEIATARDNLVDALNDSPSLSAKFQEFAEGEWGRALREAARKLQDDERGTRDLGSLVYLTLAGPNAAHVLDPEYFPEPVGSE